MQPYNQKYQKKKKTIYYVIPFTILVIIIGILFLMNGKAKTENIYIGKVIKIEGSINDTGVVEKYKEGKTLLIKSESDGFVNPVLYQLGGSYSIKILANSKEEYLKTKKIENEVSKGIKNDVPVNTSTSIPEKNPENLQPGIPTIPETQSKLPKTEEASNSMDKTTSDEPKFSDAPPETKPALQDFPEEIEKTNLELRKEQGLKEFDETISRIAKDADELDISWNRYRDACAQKYTEGDISGSAYAINNFGRPWFIFWEGSISISNESTVACLSMYSDISRISKKIKNVMQDAISNARRSSLYPGQVRDIRRKYRMDWQGWD